MWRMSMSSRNRKTAELSRERMRAGIVDRERGDTALLWVLRTPPALRNADPRLNGARARDATAGTTKRPG
jgi:hypothetical protein